MELLVYTAIMGPDSGDRLKPVPQELLDSGRAEFICFTDQRLAPVKGWKMVRQPTASRPRQAARILKTETPLFDQYQFSLWIDASYEITGDVCKLLRFAWLHDLTTYKHDERDCAYDEARVCASRKLDDPLVIERQVDRYESAGFPKRAGLAETGCVLRKHTDAVMLFNGIWRSEIRNYSIRDQISFDFSVWKSKIKYGYLPGVAHCPGKVDGETILQWHKHQRVKNRPNGRR